MKKNAVVFIFMALFVSCGTMRQKKEILQEMKKIENNLEFTQFDTSAIRIIRDSLTNGIIHINRKKWSYIEKYFIELKTLEEISGIKIIPCKMPKFTTTWINIPVPTTKKLELQGSRSAGMEAQFELERKKIRMIQY